MRPILAVRDLRVTYPDRSAGGVRGAVGARVAAVDGVNLDVFEGETLAIVGDSGAGKSTLAEALVGLARPAEGSIRFDGAEIVGLRGRERHAVRRRIQLVAQNPLLALSPRRRIVAQISEPLQVHTRLNRTRRTEVVDELVAAVGLRTEILHRLPHELSGGEAQLVVLARALILEPSLILFDEPTSALDVSVQAGVFNLLRRLKADNELTYLFITHDLGVARHLADHIAVMRHGRIVEQQPAAALFTAPRHGYTRSLLRSSPAV